MRRFSLVIPLLIVLLVGLVVGRGSLITRAQEGTPAADEFEQPPEGVTFTPLGFGTTQALPATPAEMFYFRLALDPGVSFAVTADDPSVALAYVESGTFTVRVEAPMQVLRAATVAAFSTPGAQEGGPPALEQIAADTEFTMGAGDSAVFPPSTAGELRNDGQEPAVLVATSVGPPEGGAATPMAGTPVP
jgi:hypothetical protein